MNNYEKINIPKVNAEFKADFLKRQYEAALEEIQKLKSDRPQGEWIIEQDEQGHTYGKCTVCGMKQYAGQLNYCPDCGAKMKGKDNE